MSSIKIWETIHSWHAKCSLAVAVRVSKKRVLYKLPNNEKTGIYMDLFLLRGRKMRDPGNDVVHLVFQRS